MHFALHLMISLGKPVEKRTTPAAILYDPDSADDIDDDDPDEDLDI
jgi:elongator complex protein 5